MTQADFASGPEAAMPPEVALRGRLKRQSLLFATLFCALLFGLSLILIAWRVDQMLTVLSQEKTDRMVRGLVEEGERGMRFGLEAGALAFLDKTLDDRRAQAPALQAAFIDAPAGTAIAHSGEPALHGLIEARWNASLLAARPAGATTPRASEVHASSAYTFTGRVLFDPAGAPAATLWVVENNDGLRAQAHAAAYAIVKKALPLMALSLALFYLGLSGWGRLTIRQLGGQPAAGDILAPRKVVALVMLAALLSPLALIWVARDASRPFLTQQIDANAGAVAATVAGEIEHALAQGIPQAELVGLDALFSERLAAAPELAWLALRGDGGKPLASVGQDGAGAGIAAASPDLEKAIAVGARPLKVVAGYPADYVDRALGAMLVDQILALVIAVFLLRELTRGLWRRSLLHPLLSYCLERLWLGIGALRRNAAQTAAARATAVQAAVRECRLALQGFVGKAPPKVATDAGTGDFGPQMTRLRLAVFLIALSDELLRPFFTVFASEMPASGWSLSPTMMAGLPVTAFMATLALAQPAGPALARRFDLRHALMAAVTLGALALGLTAFAGTTWVLVLLRAASGAAFGLGMILVQTTVVRYGPPARRARNLAEVAAALIAAGIVGPPFGGMIAGRVGDGNAILACALCMAFALFSAARLALPRAQPAATAGKAPAAPEWQGYMAVLRNPRAMAVILGSALPARLAAVTVLIFAVPMAMHELEQPAALAGRVQLLYFLGFALTASWIAHWSDALGQRKPFIVAGCLLAGLACLAMPLLGGVSGMVACCALLGVAQAVQSSPQIALVTDIFDDMPAALRHGTPEQALVAFRLIERGGSIVAPFVTALAVAWLGLSGAIAAVGLFVGLAGLGVWLALRPPVKAPAAAPV